MNILFINAYFYPEIIAFTHLEQDIIDGLLRAGHKVTVVCPVPSRGVSAETAEKYKKIKRENKNGVFIHRYWAPRERKNPIIRALRYFWCNFRGNAVGKRVKNTDLIFAVSTPPTQGYFAGKLAKKLGVPFVYSLQDVFPDSLVTSGITSEDSFIFRVGARIEKKTYALCSRIIVLSKTAQKQLLDKGVESSKLLPVSNWIDTEKVYPIDRSENGLFEEFNVDSTAFTVVYAGNLGSSQGAGVILKAAELLMGNSDIRFVIFGGGSEYESACDYVREHGLDNVTINPLLPVERSSEIYSLGDAALITCKKGVGKTALPSKLWSIMACNTPIIASFDTDSELAEILADSGAGVCVEPENAEALASEIERSYINKATAATPRETPREYIARRASKDRCVGEYVGCVNDALEAQARK